MSKGCGQNFDGWHRCGMLEMGSEIVPMCDSCKPKPIADKFTQGEWQVVNKKHSKNIIAKLGDLHVVTDIRASEFTAESDAHLFAASKKMYRMLKVIHNEAIDYQLRKGGKTTWQDELGQLLAEARGES